MAPNNLPKLPLSYATAAPGCARLNIATPCEWLMGYVEDARTLE